MRAPGRRPQTNRERGPDDAVGGHRSRSGARAASLAAVSAVAALLLATSARAETSILDPEGPRAARIADLWWIMFAVGTAVFVAVMALLLVAVLRARRQGGAVADGGTRPILVGVVITTAIVIGLVGLTFWAQRDLAAPAAPAGLTVEVVGHQFWWEIRYPDEEVVTANEIHIPVGEPVAVRLTADDVIHSFWVPQLSGKLDLVPGRINEFWIEADATGVYHGECAEFCGDSHALMRLDVIAEPREQFDAWIDDWRAGPAQHSAQAAGTGDVSRAPASMGACLACHLIEGTNLNVAPPQLGPNLTLYGCRIHAVSGVLPNTPENLATWLRDPGAVKPGNNMATVIKPGVLDEQMIAEIVGYLESLTPEGGCPSVTGEVLPEHVASPADIETAAGAAAGVKRWTTTVKHKQIGV